MFAPVPISRGGTKCATSVNMPVLLQAQKFHAYGSITFGAFEYQVLHEEGIRTSTAMFSAKNGTKEKGSLWPAESSITLRHASLLAD